MYIPISLLWLANDCTSGLLLWVQCGDLSTRVIESALREPSGNMFPYQVFLVFWDTATNHGQAAMEYTQQGSSTDAEDT